MKDVLISIPIPPNGNLTADLVKFLLNVTHHPTLDIGVDIVQGKPIDSVRNHAVNKFLATDYKYMLAIDSDITPPINVVDELLSHKKPFVGATCFSFQYDAPFAVILDRTLKGEGGYEQSKNIGKERLIKCHATGAACILLERQMLLDIQKHLKDKTGKTMFFETLYRDDGSLSWGQDFMFCEHAKDAGYDLYVDTGVICGHFVNGFDLKKVNDFWAKTNQNQQKTATEMVNKIQDLERHLKCFENKKVNLK